MTNEFREMTEQLAKGLNFKGGTAILVATTPDDKEVHTYIKGNIQDMLIGICCVLSNMLTNADDTDASQIREAIKHELIKDEEIRFQRKEVE